MLDFLNSFGPFGKKVKNTSTEVEGEKINMLCKHPRKGSIQEESMTKLVIDPKDLSANRNKSSTDLAEIFNTDEVQLIISESTAKKFAKGANKMQNSPGIESEKGSLQIAHSPATKSGAPSPASPDNFLKSPTAKRKLKIVQKEDGQEKDNGNNGINECSSAPLPKHLVPLSPSVKVSKLANSVKLNLNKSTELEGFELRASQSDNGTAVTHYIDQAALKSYESAPPALRSPQVKMAERGILKDLMDNPDLADKDGFINGGVVLDEIAPVLSPFVKKLGGLDSDFFKDSGEGNDSFDF